ncbi:MAG: YicC family protein [Kiritimatiellaceae bacterium]|nr:YicC family protein [Kiritimatiellaceae bacterium]
MSIKSMTGYGAAAVRAGEARVTVELSSVNRKQLDVVFRLPPSLAALESRIQKIIQEQISRGRISGTVLLEAANGGAMIQIDQVRAEETVKQLRRTAKKLNLTDDLSASALLQVPGLLKMQSGEQTPEEIFPFLEKTLTAALKKLNAMRLREGKALEADFLARLKLLEQMLAAIQARAPQIAANYRKKLFDGLESAGLKNIAADERIIKEIALFGERSDISEEATRLTSHIQQFKKILRGGEPAGRPLDFLAQEFFREINTIGSKANDLKITEQVVAFKTELERIREQIQNVE